MPKGKMTMISAATRHALRWGLLLVVASVAPVPREQEARKESTLAEARYNAARKQFDLIWQYYQQSRVESDDVYFWSRLLLEASKGVAVNKEQLITAFEQHLDRMKKLEALIKKIRRLGFGRSSDVGASEYYRIEAESWVAETKS
jgi:hypothetical protein